MNENVDSPSALMTVPEAAAYLRVPKSWVYERTRIGAIPVRRIGGLVRIPRAELEAWVNQQDHSH